jgi:predicted Zn-dependent protease
MHAFRLPGLGLALMLIAAADAVPAATPDPEMLDRGSDIAYRRALAPAADDKRLNADAAATARVRRIANRLVVSATTMNPEWKRYRWAVNLVPGAGPDVSVYPGGRAIVTDALVDKTGLADEEIGAILAHAFAHMLLGHDARQLAPRVPVREDPVDPNRLALDVAAATTDTMRGLRYTPAEIAAADRTSVEMLARAAYDPRAAGSAWRRLAHGRKGIVERSPVNDERLAALDVAIRATVPLYEETRAKAEAQARDSRPPPRISGPSKGGPPIR